MPRALPRLSWLDEKRTIQNQSYMSRIAPRITLDTFEGFSLAVEPPHKLFVWNFALSTKPPPPAGKDAGPPLPVIRRV